MKIIEVATTTDTVDSVRIGFERLKNLYGMSAQVNETTKKSRKVESVRILEKCRYDLKTD